MTQRPGQRAKPRLAEENKTQTPAQLGPQIYSDCSTTTSLRYRLFFDGKQTSSSTN